VFRRRPTVVRGIPRCRPTATFAGLTSARPMVRAEPAFEPRRMAERHQNRAKRGIDSAKSPPLDVLVRDAHRSNFRFWRSAGSIPRVQIGA
jgi:hypothetical protein